MMLPDTITPDLIGGILGFFFTVSILSYLIGDNPLFRFALHIFIGSASGYVALVTINEVLRPRFVSTFSVKDPLALAIISVPLVLFLFLVLKLRAKISSLGNITIGFLIGVGAGTALGASLTGTLIPQVEATWLSLIPGGDGNLINNLIMIFGVVATLVSFQYWLNQKHTHENTTSSGLIRLTHQSGKGLISIALGAVYGGLIISGIAILTDRVIALISLIRQISGS